MANVLFWSKTLVSGGTAPALDSIDGAGLVDGDFAHVTVAGVLYVYKLNATSGAAEVIPTIISPDTNAGTKRWILQGVNANGLIDNSCTASLPLFTGASKELVSKSVVDTRTALGLGTADSPVFVTAKLSGLTDGYVPKHTSDAVGLVDSPIYTDGTNVGIGTTPTTRNNTHLQIVDGIGFPATQVASSDPNTLDDYEEGTCTATLTCTSGTITLDTNTLKYIKVGAKVTINGSIHASSVSSPSGDLVLGGLPFAIPNSAQNYAAGSLFPEALAAGSLTLPMIRMITNTATALLGRYLNGAYTAMAADIPNGGQMAIGITYFTV